MKPAISYSRVSSREQEQEGFSLGAQSKLIRDYVARNSFHVEREFEDVETAKTKGRKAFSEMLKWLKQNHHCRTVLVEKTDRLYRNFHDFVALEDLDVEIHLVKEGRVISKTSKSQDKFLHGIQLVVARNYCDNLKEEVEKGMREKAALGIYPGRVPFGYKNNKANRTVEVDPVNFPIAFRVMELYGSGEHTISTIRKAIKSEYGKKISKNGIHKI